MRAPLTRPVWPLVAAIVFTFAMSLPSLLARHRVESQNRAVGICLEAQVIQEAAIASGVGFDSACVELKKRGITALALSEPTLAEWVTSGIVEYHGGFIQTSTSEAADRIRASLGMRFGKRMVTESGDVLNTEPLPRDVLDTIPLGLDPEEARTARDTRLEIVARHMNVPGCTRDYVRGCLKRSAQLGATYYLPEGEQVLGNRDLLEDTYYSLGQNNIMYAWPEFAKLSGDARLADFTEGSLLRLHSIQAAEANNMQLPEYLERFTKAARERDVRLLLLRPLNTAGIRPLEALGSLVGSVRDSLAEAGMEVKSPHLFEKPVYPEWTLVGVGIGVALIGIQLAFWLSQRTEARYGLAVIAAITAGFTFKPQLLPFAALFAAIVLPIAAYQWALSIKNRNPWLVVLGMSAISLVGGLCVAAYLNGPMYYNRLDQFTAVKLAHFLPIVIIAVVVLREVGNIGSVLAEPARWISLIIALVAVAGLGLMLARTGNDNPAAVSGLELRFRSILDTVLYARPRSKEFLVGHPALILGLLMWFRPNIKPSAKRLAGALLILGAIGQTSIVNTLCHLHTPILIGVARIAIGLVIGAIIGLVLWLLIRKRVEAVPA